MGLTDVFSPVAFFICLRETLEAGIIIAVLLGFINQVIPVQTSTNAGSCRSSTELLSDPSDSADYGTPSTPLGRRGRDGEGRLEEVLADTSRAREGMIRKMRMQIWSGAILGGLGAAVIGAVFLYVFYSYAHDLWQDAENLWEGGFCAIASFLILIMGLAFLRLPHAQVKWRLKLLSAYHDKHESELQIDEGEEQPSSSTRPTSRRGKGGRMILFGLPFVTVLREGLEGVVFLGGIGLSESPLSIAGGALVGGVVGGLIAFLLFSSSAPMPLKTFTTTSTLLLFLIGAGLASRSAYSFERQYFINGVGAAAAESGTGPGSYRVAGNIWKLDYGNPEPGAPDGSGYAQLAQSLVGWNNIGTVWTVTTYVGYWGLIIFTLITMKWKEGRTEVCGVKSKRGWQRELARRVAQGEGHEEQGLLAQTQSSIE